MELGQLRAVLALIEHGSFTRAARALAVTQPTLSIQVGRLERALGTPLFRRDRTGVTPTAACLRLSEHAREALAAADRAVAAVRPPADPAVLRVGSLRGSWNPWELADAVRARLDAADRRDVPVTPEVEAVTTAPTPGTAALREGRLDLLVGYRFTLDPPPGDATLTVAEFHREPVWLALAAGHPLARRSRPTLGAFRDETWLVLDGDADLGDLVPAACRAYGGFEPRLAPVAVTDELVPAIAAGRGVTLCSPLAHRRNGITTRDLRLPLRKVLYVAARADAPHRTVLPLVVAAVRDLYLRHAHAVPPYRRWLAQEGGVRR